MEYRIVCKILSSDESRIEKVGIVEPSGDPNKSTVYPTKKINELIGEGHTVFFVATDGVRVEVSEYGDDFIRTNPDGYNLNNLRELRDCSL